LRFRAAELLNSIPETSNTAQPTDYTIPAFSPNPDPEEARLEYLEFNRYLLAKSFFDCREFDRCAAVFLPDTVLAGVAGPRQDGPDATSPAKGKGKAGVHAQPTAASAASAASVPRISQKSLFLALYAKYMSGEKRKDEESEMVMGPQDVGTVINKQLLTVSRFLSSYFKEREEEGDVGGSQGWLEYLWVALVILDVSLRC
jgi:anaphase-promoting complex subunit 8